jgi:hypothetical protein
LQELEIALEDERRNGDDVRAQLTTLERKRIALQTELEDVRTLLEAVSIIDIDITYRHSQFFSGHICCLVMATRTLAARPPPVSMPVKSF